MLESLLFQGLTGISHGMFLWLVASGLTIIFGILGIINFAQGVFYMLGALATYSFIRLTGNFWFGIILGPPFVGAVAFFLEKFLLKPLYKLDETYQLLLTFALALILENLAKIIWGSGYIPSPSVKGFNGFVMLFGRPFPTYYIFIIFFGFLSVILLWVMLRFTWFGRILQATSTKKEMAAMLGVNVSFLYSIVFAFGAYLSAIGGGLVIPMSVTSSAAGDTVIIQAFAVVVIGGLGSLKGAFIASLLIGLTEAYSIMFLPSFEMAIIYIVMAIVLIAKPSGLAGEND